MWRTSSRRERCRAFGVGILGVLVSLACGALLFAAVSPALSSADEGVHLDYAWQVSQGRLPVYEDGPEIHVPREVRLPNVQWAAQHPPLFYLIEAQFVRGPLADRNWRLATAVGRSLTIFFALLCVPALAWAAGQAVTRRRALWALATAAVAAPIEPFVGVSGAVYNDTLAVLAIVLALGVAMSVLRRGLSWARLAAATTLAVAGMSTRASFAATLAILLAAIVAAAAIHGRQRIAARLLVGAGAAAGVLAVTAAAIGWFYLRNVRLTGNWIGVRPDLAVERLGRSRHSVLEVLTMPDFWQAYRRLLFEGPAGSPLRWVGPALLVLLSVTALIGAVAHRPWRRAGVVNTAVAAVLVTQAVGVVVTQALYVAQAGGNAPRYLLPSLLPIALVLAAGALAWPRLRAYALVAVVAICWLLLVDRLRPFRYFPGGATANGVPAGILAIMVAGIAVGVLLQALGLRRVYRLSAPGAGASAGERGQVPAPATVSVAVPDPG